LIWADASRVGLVRQVLERMDTVKVLTVGGPSKGAVSELASELEVPAEDDLRQMLLGAGGEGGVDSLMVATGEGLSGKALQQARDLGVPVLALEPVAAHQDDVVESEVSGGAFQVMTAPWLRMSPGWKAAANPQEALGQIQALQIGVLAPSGVCSLYARLYDAMDMAIHLLGLPETIDAALTGPLSEPPERLRGLTGHLTAHLRFTTDASAALTVSDRSPTWDRRLLALGSEGQIALGDTSYTLTNKDGQTLDALAPESDKKILTPADLIARLWNELHRGAVAPKPVDPRQIIACCDAALLSCRTAQLESPATMLRLGGG
jgi:hypothetical protein